MGRAGQEAAGGVWELGVRAGAALAGVRGAGGPSSHRPRRFDLVIGLEEKPRTPSLASRTWANFCTRWIGDRRTPGSGPQSSRAPVGGRQGPRRVGELSRHRARWRAAPGSLEALGVPGAPRPGGASMPSFSIPWRLGPVPKAMASALWSGSLPLAGP